MENHFILDSFGVLDQYIVSSYPVFSLGHLYTQF